MRHFPVPWAPSAHHGVPVGTAKERDSIGVILKRGYIDLIPLNAFYDGEEYLFYDQEMYVENLPAKSILLSYSCAA